jgi:hypothetical protein
MTLTHSSSTISYADGRLRTNTTLREYEWGVISGVVPSEEVNRVKCFFLPKVY